MSYKKPTMVVNNIPSENIISNIKVNTSVFTETKVGENLNIVKTNLYIVEKELFSDLDSENNPRQILRHIDLWKPNH